MIVSITSRIVEILNLIGLGPRFINFVFGGEEFFEVNKIYSPLLGRISKRLTLFLPGRGCSWSKESGGCTMCGFSQKLKVVNKKWNFSAPDLFAFYRMAELLSQAEEPGILCVFNGGSFLNPGEVPIETQLAIANAVKSHPNLSFLFIESRPEFITDESLSFILSAMGRKKLEIGIGLEAVTEKVREVYIHKGFNLIDYEKAVATIKSHRAFLLTYVFLKPLHLSEREATEEAVRTIEYAFKTGSDEVSLSCAFIQNGTRMAKAYEQGEFKPPWLWSIIEVIQRTAHLGPVRIGSFEDEPPPIAIPSNCPKCSQKVERAIQEYNLRRNIQVFAPLSCECQEKWKREKA